MTDWVRMGTVQTVNPARREIRVKLESRHKRQLDERAWIYVAPPGEDPMKVRVTEARRNETDARLTLAAGVPRDRVRTMRGAGVLLPPDALGSADETEWTASEWVGFTARDRDGNDIGTVTAAYETPMNSAIEILSESSGIRLMAPVIEQVIALVDLEAGCIELNDLEGYAIEVEEEED